MRGETDFYGHFQPWYIDTIVLGQLALSQLDGMSSYKLEIMAEKVGIELDDAHDADADVTATTNVAMVCSQRMRNASGIEWSLAFEEEHHDLFFSSTYRPIEPSSPTP